MQAMALAGRHGTEQALGGIDTSQRQHDTSSGLRHGASYRPIIARKRTSL
jgi:hypothetical protein